MHMEITSIQPQFISWNRDHYGSYIFNVGGSSQNNSRMTKFDFLIRDSDGHSCIVSMVILVLQYSSCRNLNINAWDSNLLSGGRSKRHYLLYWFHAYYSYGATCRCFPSHHYGNAIAIIGKYMCNTHTKRI